MALVKIQGLSNYALKGVSLEIQEKEIFGIIGSSGAGKTTLMKCMVGLLQGSKGEVVVAEEKVSHLKGASLRSARQKVGMIFQHFNLFSAQTALENVLFPMQAAKQANKARARELLALVGLEAKGNCYPQELSGGEKQRVAIARALANNPKILFCDEATSALDPNTTHAILQLLQKVNQELGVTIVMITHEMEVIKQVCHKVAILDKGHIVEEGKVADIFASPSHSTTIDFLQHLAHEVPPHFLTSQPGKKLVRLRFKGACASEPLISKMVREIAVEVNILLGGIDSLQETIVGNLVVELAGSEKALDEAVTFLRGRGVGVERVQ